jgi:hypothetical protein
MPNARLFHRDKLGKANIRAVARVNVVKRRQ